MHVQRDKTHFLWWTNLVQFKGDILMSVLSHVQELKKKHQSLSDAVEVAQRSPGVDDLQILELKKQKLRLKEEISRLSS